MDRRAFLKAGSAAVAAAGVSRIAAAQSETAPWRAFEVVTRVQVLDADGVTRVWLPTPLTRDTDYFKNLGNDFAAESGTATYVHEQKYGTGIVAGSFPASAQNPVLRLTSRFAARDRYVDLSKPPRVAPKEDPAELRLALQPTELIPTDGIVKDKAMEITKGQRTDIDKARAIYEWIVENTFRDPKVRGCGWGDIKGMLETGNLGGKCGDLNALFVGLSRASGVPARDIYGIRVAKSNHGFLSMGANTESVTRAQHCRAEFWSQQFGWVPVDPADVRKVALEEPPGNRPLSDPKVQEARKKLFGYWEMNWLAYNRAHDLTLPGSSGGWKVPYFMYPDGQTAKGRLDPLEPDQFQYTIAAKELKAI
ncbi:MAG TPA: transglutaminase-like domain-containing protein [Burkholderiales bacterium]|nr:transglutaminase-like domain-containing protein [Burkholderiales bacterium]